MTRAMLSSLAIAATMAAAASQLTVREAFSRELGQKTKTTAPQSGRQNLVNPQKKPQKSVLRFGNKKAKLCLAWGGDKCQ